MRWWIDATAGASGDMLLGALLDLDPAGLEPAQRAVDEVLHRLGEPGSVRLGVEAASRCGMAANRALVDASDSVTHRTWTQIAQALDGYDRAYRVFEALAIAEATVHGVEPADIHFHEVGALDAIADIVAVTTLWGRLAPAHVDVSPVCVGSGTVRTSHGTLSVPVPAVAHLLSGVPTFAGAAAHEACTPTGAALLKVLATSWGGQPLMAVEHIGVGAGSRDLVEQPNVLRVLAGDAPATTEQMTVVETTIDDLDPRVYPDVMTAAKQAGAVECWLTPVIMKLGRPATVLTALTPPGAAEAVGEVLLRETNTLGIRMWSVDRQALQRDTLTVQVEGRPISVKRGWLRGRVVTAQPEYREALDVARLTGIPVKVVLDRARAASEGESPESRGK